MLKPLPPYLPTPPGKLEDNKSVLKILTNHNPPGAKLGSIARGLVAVLAAGASEGAAVAGHLGIDLLE